jgi:hypothetical protein
MSLTVFKDRELKIVFWPQKNETIGSWRELHNEELRNFYTLEWLSQEGEMGRDYRTHGKMMNGYKDFW